MLTTILAAALSDLLESTGARLPDAVVALRLCAAFVSLAINVDRAVHSWRHRRQCEK